MFSRRCRIAQWGPCRHGLYHELCPCPQQEMTIRPGVWSYEWTTWIICILSLCLPWIAWHIRWKFVVLYVNKIIRNVRELLQEQLLGPPLSYTFSASTPDPLMGTFAARPLQWAWKWGQSERVKDSDRKLMLEFGFGDNWVTTNVWWFNTLIC